MSTSWIVWPQEGHAGADILGGKGAALWTLWQHDMPIPPTCCVTVAAYQAWAQAGKPERLPAPLADLLAGALQRLREQGHGVARFAVRSSAVAEDSQEASFAGQLRTLLNVAAADVAAAIVSVWHSAEATAAVAYRARVQQHQGGVAVLLQSLLAVETAGVVFTAEPLSGASQHLVLNATWGLGEGVVSGVVTPDHWVIDRASRQIVHCTIGAKACQVVAAPAGGTLVSMTPAARAAQASLTAAQVDTLVALALQVEAQAGAPQDIEWAYGHGQFWLLQARPISTLAAQGWRSEFDTETAATTVWTAANIQEVLPGPITPLSWSLLQEHLNAACRKTFTAMRTLLDPTTAFVALFYDRVFLNVSALRQVAARTLATSPAAVDEQYLGVARDPKAPRRRPSLRQWLTYVRTTPPVLWHLSRTPARVRRMDASLQTWLSQTQRQDLRHVSATALVTALQEAGARNRDIGAVHLATTSGASAYFENLGRLLQRWYGDEASVLRARLTSGLHNVASAVPSVELTALAALGRQDATLHKALLTDDPWGQLQTLHSPQAAAFRQRFEQFLQRHGYRCVREFEISALAWEEDPNSVLTLLQNFLALPPEAAPEQVLTQAETQRLEAMQSMMARCHPPQRWVLRWAVGQAQAYVAYRERTKALWMQVNHRLRRLLREVGRRLTAQEVLTEPHELYFLTMAEVQSLLLSELSTPDVAARVRRRRAAAMRNAQVVLPESFQGRPQPQWQAPPVQTSPSLRGIPVSPGVVTGPARVILDPRQAARIEPGDILVAPVTDAGWTPLFLIAAGLVVDIGGPLSHGAIVAREYGLPTVVNVKTATQIVRTGDTITLNGATGEVFVSAPR